VEERRSARDVFGVAILAALIALTLAFGAQRGRRAVPAAARAGEITELGGAIAHFSIFPASGRIDVVSADGRSRADLEMSLIVDGAERPLVMRRSDVQLRDKLTLAASFPIEVGEEHATGILDLRMDPASDFLTASVVVTPDTGSSAHTYALRIGLAPAGRSLFAPGAGTIADLGTTQARAVVIDDDTHPIALLSAQGSLAVAEVPPDLDQAGAQPRVIVTAQPETAAERRAGASPKPARLDIGILVGGSEQLVWGRLYRLLRAPVGRIAGVVTGTHERAHVIGLDEDGRPMVRVAADAQGHFAIDAPTSAVQWFAALEAAHTSAPVRFTPGTPWDLKLDVSPGGELRVRVIDADTNQPIVSRLIVKGIEGTIDPSFGPDYRASGAGPIMDVLEGDVATPLPAGKYRVAATKGMEWSIDAEAVEVQSGHTKTVDLALRHVIPTPGVVGCDLHVHARPSFDSPVTGEDRVLSLVSAGVDFAVPTEHNIVGDYSGPLEVLKLTKQLATVTGVEVTTYNPRFGHFGVFPYPASNGVPPFKGATAAGVFSAAKRGDPTRVFQVNHPRLPSGIGYFNVVGFDPKVGRIPVGMRTDFDTLEVYNGYDLATRGRTEQVMEDWFALLTLGKHYGATGSSDSHRIQYQWAGYPRTMVLVDPKAAGDTGQPIDTTAVIAAIKRGHTFVTSGPMIELELGNEGKTARPGDDLPAPHGANLTGRLRIRAAPWVDVTSVEVLTGIPATAIAPSSVVPAAPLVPGAGRREVLFKSKIPSRPTRLGKEDGTLEEAAARTIRFETDLDLAVPEGARWIVVVVRGDRALDDALPSMPIQPLAFTSPIWLTR
jgi:hypothetical protein